MITIMIFVSMLFGGFRNLDLKEGLAGLIMAFSCDGITFSIGYALGQGGL